MKISVTTQGNFRNEITVFVKGLAQDTFDTVRVNTPIKSGNARRNWTKDVSSNTFNVSNKVPYIERLEAGASRQAPKGIIGPTLTTIKGKYK
jgi:hypothetical protein